MAWSDFFNAPQQNTSATPDFNYNTSSDVIKRKRMLSDMLLKQGQQQQQGQFIKSGDFTGFVGGNTPMSSLAQMLTTAAGLYGQNASDQSQRDLDTQSNQALQTALDNKPTGAEIPKDEAGLDALIAAKSGPDAPAPQQPVVQASTPPMPYMGTGSSPAAGGAPAPAPQGPVNPQAAVKALPTFAGGGQGTPPVAQAPVEDQNGYLPGEGIMDRAGRRIKAALRMTAMDPSKAPSGSAADDPQFAALKGLIPAQGATAMMTPQLPAAPAPAPQSPIGAATGGAAPAMPPTAPQVAPTSGAAPAPAPVAPGQADPAPQSPIGAATQPPMLDRTAAEANANNGHAAPTQGQQVAYLSKLAQTGPMGQQIATAEMNQIFGSKNGRFATTVHADPVNGGFIQVVTDTATGRTQSSPLGSGAGNGKGAYTETTAADGTRMKVYKNGAPSEPLVDTNGTPLKDAAVIRGNDEQKLKTSNAVVSNQSARSSIDSSIARLDRIEQLYKETETGPVTGHLPNWTAKRQELQALLAQDIFAETRDAVAGAADAGGAPKMTQREFEFMKNNGGLQQTTTPEAATNIIAQQRLRLNALRGTLSKHADALDSLQGTSSGEQKAPAKMMYSWQK